MRGRGRFRRGIYTSVNLGVGTVVISGDALEFETLTAVFNDDDPDGAASDITYQWRRDGANIPGAAATTYVLVHGDVNRNITVAVTYRDAKGFVHTIISNSIGPIVLVPVGPASFSIAGDAFEHETLTATLGVDPDGAIVVGPTYQWYRAPATAIGGATASTYVLVAADVGFDIFCRVEYEDEVGQQEVLDSNLIGPIVAIDDGDSDVPTISGVAHEGNLLTLTFPNNDPDGAASGITYQWIRGASTNIPGANATTYTVVEADIGSTLKVRVNYTDGQGFSESVTSDPTATVTGETENEFNAGSGTFIVPVYEVLEIEGWGGGASGAKIQNGLQVPGVAGSFSRATVGALVLTANGGNPSVGSSFGTATGGTGGTATNGDANTTGGSGGNAGQTYGASGGQGGNAPLGGLGGAARTEQSVGSYHGNEGNAPGAGGGGGARVFTSSDFQKRWGAGGGSGAYFKKTFIYGVTPGYPEPGSSIPWIVGDGAPTNVATGLNPMINGGRGANGRILFTVTSADDDGDATVDIAGTEQEGELLTATFNDDDPDGAATGVTYQWIRNAATVIAGATNSTYTLQAADVGNTVKVRVNYTDAQEFEEEIFSASTGTTAAAGGGVTDALFVNTADDHLLVNAAGDYLKVTP